MTELALRNWCRRFVASLRANDGLSLSLVGHLERATGEVEDSALRAALERAIATVAATLERYAERPEDRAPKCHFKP